MKYFVISDIHAHYNEMIYALQSAGYSESNDQHHLLVLGDLFDRGTQSVQVLDYLYPLSMQNKATVILGNHDLFLLEFLEEQYQSAYFNVRYNGFDKTLFQFSGIHPNYDNMPNIRDIILDRYSFLYRWIRSFPYYLEFEKYIFVHGGIDGGKLDWRTMTSRKEFVWNNEITLPKVANKTVVAGHHRVATIRQKTKDYHLLFLHHPEYFDILYEEGKILIDRFVEVSGEINVLKIDVEDRL